MAVVNKYTNADKAAGKLTNAAFSQGNQSAVAVSTFEVAAADSDGSIYRFLSSIPEDMIPVRIEVYNDAITSGTDYDLGFYEPLVDGVGGAVIDKEVLAAVLDMSSAAGQGSPKSGLNAVALEDSEKKIYELLGQSLDQRKLGYDMALTANTVGSIAGTITVKVWFVQG